MRNSRDIPPKISPYPLFFQRGGLGVDGEESPLEKGGQGGFEFDFSRCIV